MRIAFGGIATESCTFSPWTTKLADFWVQRGEEMVAGDRYPFFAEHAATFLPTLAARALPGGSVETAVYHHLKTELITRLQALGPIDGFYLDLHGAMNVLGMDDAEGDLATAVRAAVGPNCLISASMDLHGNISERFVHAIDMLTAYRTAPHVDTLETRAKAVAMLVGCLQNGSRPHILRLPVPIILPGERTSTEVEPGATVYAALQASDSVAGLLDASIFVGYVWADEPRASATVIVSGFDDEAMRTEARRLGQIYWEARHDFVFGVPAGSADDCLDWAVEAPNQPVFISDSGDNPTAGGVGDVAAFAERLLARDDIPSAVLASIVDETAVFRSHEAGLGGGVTLSLGGKLDPVHGRPLTVQGTVIHLSDSDPVAGKIAVVQVKTSKIIITQRRKPYHYIADFQALGINPHDHKIVVVKIGYLVPDLKQAAAHALLALTPGAVNQDIPSLSYHRVQRPIYPLDPEMSWAP
jgi:microcystin degradation protein MlrC